jgi:hypothetical protein
MLLMADSTGYIEAAVPGLAGRARITLEECETALDKFQKPDPYSKNQEQEGRRIERVDRGWQLINYQAYRDMRTESQVKRAERQQRWRDGVREKKRLLVDGVDAPVVGVGVQKGEGRREKGESTPTTTARAEFRNQLTLEGHEALDGLVRASQQPEALIGECVMILAGERQIKPRPTPEGLSLALCDLVTNGQRPTARSLRTYTADAMRHITEGVDTTRSTGHDSAWDKAEATALKRDKDAGRK